MPESSQLHALRQTAAEVVAGCEASINRARELRAVIESERAERRLREEDRRARLGLVTRWRQHVGRAELEQ